MLRYLELKDEEFLVKKQAFAKHLFAWTCLVAGAASTVVAQNQPAAANPPAVAPSVMTQSQPAAPSGSAASHPFKVAVIEIQSAILGTKDGQKATQEFATRFDPRKKELEQKAAEINELKEKLQRGGAAMADAAKADLTRTIEQKTKSYNRDMEDANAEFQAEQSKVLDDLGQKMMQVIERYAQANGYAVVIDVSNPQTPVMYASSAANITKDIVTLYDKTLPAPASTGGAKPAATPMNSPAKPAAVPQTKKQQ
jgi:outer membrane protein